MFRIIIRIIFIFAYGAFLYASLRHIAFFFASFEPVGTDWTGAYALAISIDVTALILTIGVMFFKKGMPWHAVAGVWFFITCLTAFSWIVNWEYAVQFQGSNLSRASQFQWINPILASSFAFLNLAYSVIAELFNSKPKSLQELQQELSDLQQKATLKQQLSTLKNEQLSGWIAGKKQVLQDAFSQEKQAAMQSETIQEVEETSPELEPEIIVPVPEILEQDISEDEVDSEETFEENPQSPLSMIEQAMYDALLKNPQEFEALQQQARALSIDDFTALLKQKYSRYASYITPTRVTNVMQFVAQQTGEKIQEIDAESGTISEEGSGRKYLMTFEEASQYTGYAMSTLRRQLKAGEIEANKTGDKLKVSTLRIKTGNTAKMPVVKPEKVLATNGHH